jgi:hypothetical protein
MPYRYRTYTHTLFLFLSIVFINVGPCTFIAIYAKWHTSTLFGDSAYVSWSFFLLFCTLMAVMVTVGIRGPYRPLAALLTLVFFQLGIGAIEFTGEIIAWLIKASPFCIGLYLCSLVIVLFEGLRRWLEFTATALLFVITPVVPLMLAGLYEGAFGRAMPSVSVLPATILGVALCMAVAPLLGRRLGRLSAKPL